MRSLCHSSAYEDDASEISMKEAPTEKEMQGEILCDGKEQRRAKKDIKWEDLVHREYDDMLAKTPKTKKQGGQWGKSIRG
jgi:hypothetical protein